MRFDGDRLGRYDCRTNNRINKTLSKNHESVSVGRALNMLGGGGQAEKIRKIFRSRGATQTPVQYGLACSSFPACLPTERLI